MFWLQYDTYNLFASNIFIDQTLSRERKRLWDKVVGDKFVARSSHSWPTPGSRQFIAQIEVLHPVGLISKLWIVLPSIFPIFSEKHFRTDYRIRQSIHVFKYINLWLFSIPFLSQSLSLSLSLSLSFARFLCLQYIDVVVYSWLYWSKSYSDTSKNISEKLNQDFELKKL